MIFTRLKPVCAMSNKYFYNTTSLLQTRTVENTTVPCKIVLTATLTNRELRKIIVTTKRLKHKE